MSRNLHDSRAEWFNGIAGFDYFQKALGGHIKKIAGVPFVDDEAVLLKALEKHGIDDGLDRVIIKNITQEIIRYNGRCYHFFGAGNFRLKRKKKKFWLLWIVREFGSNLENLHNF